MINDPNKEPDQKNLLLAIVLSAAVLLLWQFILPPPVEMPADQPSPASVSETPESASPKNLAASPASTPSPAKVAAVDPASIQRKTLVGLKAADRHGIELSSFDGQIESWTLYEDQYRVNKEDGTTEPFRFVSATEKASESQFLPPNVKLSLAGSPQIGEYSLAESTVDHALLEWSGSPTGVKVSKRYTVNAERFTTTVKLTLTNPTNAAVKYDLTTDLQAIQRDSDASGSMFMPPIHLYESICQRADDFERMPAETILEAKEDNDPTAFTDGISWGGVDNRYFMTGLVAPPGTINSCDFSATRLPNQPGFTQIQNTVKLTDGTLNPGQTVERMFVFYGGPKKRSELEALDVSMANAIDFGFFSVICIPMLWLMGLFHSYMPNWGIAIILLTVLVKLLTLPLTIKQYRSMAQMKKVQPQMKAIQEKHSEDKVRMQQEMMKLYRENNVNPLAGCLPMLMMMPIYFALYRTIFSAVELYQADFALWITDLSQQDPYYLTPLLLGGLMVIQFKLNPSAGGDQMQMKIMMYVMPVMFTAMMLFLPSGLVLYILVNTVLGIAQQYYMYRQSDLTLDGAKA